MRDRRLTDDEVAMIRAGVPQLSGNAAWLIELAWCRYSHDVWAAGCIHVEPSRIENFALWVVEQDR